MATDLEKAVAALRGKNLPYSKLWQYYDGNHPLVYSSERLREVFRNLTAHFTENWCAVVVDSVSDRLELPRFLVAKNTAATELLNRLWMETELNLGSDDAHQCALVTSEAFVIVWRGEDGVVEAYFNDSRLCHVEYDRERPRRMLWAAKWWEAEEALVPSPSPEGRGETAGPAKKIWRLTMYYADRLEYYEAQSAQMPEKASAFKPLADVWPVNPFGEIPVFHLRLNTRVFVGELTQGVVELQDAINKLLADMMVAAEFGAFRQRYVISTADIGALKNAPNEVWDLPASDGISQDTSVGEFGETNLGGYLNAMERLSASIGIISRTPKTYFVKLPTHEVSGEALMALESPLIKKCRKRIERFTATWRKVARFMLRLSGAEVDALDIEVLFDAPETVQPRTRAEIRQMNNNAGYPMATALREEGRSEAYIAQVMADKRKMQAEAQRSLAQAMMEQQRRFSQEEGPGEREADGDA